MKRKIRKTILLSILSLSLFVSLLTLTNTEPVIAATKNYMKDLKGISWDLNTKGKWFTVQSKFAGIGMKTIKARITKWKITKLPTDMKILSFRVTINNQIKLSNSQIHKMVSSSYYKKARDVRGYGGFCIVDYNTGKCLEVADNPNGVKVSETGWKISNKKKYKDNHGCIIYLYSLYDDITVRYFHGDDIAVGIFGHKSLLYDAGDSKFWNGKAPFGKTSMYSKTNKKLSRFKHIKY